MDRLDSSVLFWADGSRVVGMGHITRSLALAHAVRAQGWHPLFVRPLDPFAEGRIRADGFPVITVDDVREEKTPKSERIELALRHKGLVGAVLDLSDPESGSDSETYIRQLSRIAERTRTLYIDDLSDIEIPDTLRVAPDREDRFGSDGNLFGPRFALVDPSFREVRSQWKLRSKIRRIVVTLGGGDLPLEPLERLLHSIRANAMGAEVSCVLGRTPSDIDRSRISRHAEILVSVRDMAHLLLDADVAITSGGVAKFEAACVGVPAIYISQVPHQEPWARGFARHGGGLALGPLDSLTEGAISEALSHFATSAVRRRISNAAHDTVDGIGAQRIAACLTNHIGATQ